MHLTELTADARTNTGDRLGRQRLGELHHRHDDHRRRRYVALPEIRLSFGIVNVQRGRESGRRLPSEVRERD